MRDPEIILISLSAFFIALITALIFSNLFKRFRIPWTVALILGGIVVGPQGLGWFHLNEIVLFLAEVGVIFLMFIAGMETRISAIRGVWKESLIIALAAGLGPAAIGLIIGWTFGYSLMVAALLGVILINSSFAVVIPTLEAKGILDRRLGKIIVASTMIQDISSLTALAILFQFISPADWLPWPVLAIVLMVAIAGGVIVRQFMPQFRQWLARLRQKQDNTYTLFEQELTLVVAILIGAAIIFELFKFETIIGAFFAGLVLAEITRSKILEHKIHVLGYGIFIPIFFVTIGAWADIQALIKDTVTVLPLALAIVLGSMAGKFGFGWLAGRSLGFPNHQSILIGVTSMPQLITTLAATLIGQRLGILTPELVTAIILLAIISVITSPLATSRLLANRPAADWQ